MAFPTRASFGKRSNALSRRSSCCPAQKKKSALRSLPFQAISMMQATQHRRSSNAVTGGKLVSMNTGRSLGLNRLRNARSQRRVWPAAIVVAPIFKNNSAQVPLAQRNDVIQAIAAKRANHFFSEAIRGGRVDGCFAWAHAETLQRRVNGWRADGVAAGCAVTFT